MLRLAWRNVCRNLRRSLITVASMACGLAAIMFGQSMIKSVQRQLIEKATSSITGHLQVQNRSIKEYKFPDKYIDDPAPVEAVLARQAGVRAFGKRINVTGLVSSPAGSVGAMICAVEPEKEKEITTISSYLTQGRYLGTSDHEAVMGDKIAQRLDLRLGEKVVLMAQADDGSMGAEAFRVVGIYHTGSTTFDGQFIYVPLAGGQALLATGRKVNQIVVRLDDIGLAERTRQELMEKLGNRPVQVLRWLDIDHEIVAIQTFQNAILDIVLLIVFAIVALGVLNTLLMSLFERVREFGVLMAIGARPRWVMKLVLAESVILGFVGTLLGLALGCTLITYYGKAGLHLAVGDALSYFLPFPKVIYLRFAWMSHWRALLAVLVVSILAALPPALRACRLNPSEALRHV
ncbi:MAG: ABC transporter permease [Elusimicrobia bacterium]|nr:ABC transporter permease [Elusimicrobiota bacterium]